LPKKTLDTLFTKRYHKTIDKKDRFYRSLLEIKTNTKTLIALELGSEGVLPPQGFLTP